jgi:hypothetical protein
VVFHQIQARRLNPDWLLSRLYWQGASTVLSRRMLHDGAAVWGELPRRLLVAILFAPAALLPRTSTDWLAIRWRQAYSAGFVRAALGWRATEAARRMARKPAPVPAIPFARLPPPVAPPATIRMPERLAIRGRTREPVYTSMRDSVRPSPPKPARRFARTLAAITTREPARTPATVTIREPIPLPPSQPIREPILMPPPQPVGELNRQPVLEPSAPGVA